MKHIIYITLTVLFACAALAEDSPNVALAKSYMTAGLNGHDYGAYDKIFADTYVDYQNPDMTKQKLKDAIESFKKPFPDLKNKIVDAVDSGDKVVLRTVFEGTYTGQQVGGIHVSGKSFTFESIDIFKISDGKILSHWGQDSIQGIPNQIK